MRDERNKERIVSRQELGKRRSMDETSSETVVGMGWSEMKKRRRETVG